MKTCFQCGEKGSDFYGIVICDACKAGLGLFTDETIARHIALYRSTKKRTYEDEIYERLRVLDVEYFKKRIKLLHALERAKYLGKSR